MVKPCPFCGKTDATFKSKKIRPILGEGRASCITKVWCACNYCGAHGRTATIGVIYTNESIVAAYPDSNFLLTKKKCEGLKETS